MLMPGTVQWIIFLCSVRKEADAELIAKEVSNLPGTYRRLIFDVTDIDAVQRAAIEVKEALHGATLGALINNAGLSYT